MENFVKQIAEDYYSALARTFAQGPPKELEQVADVLFEAFLRRRTVYTIGNGASAALAAHMACDMGKGTATDLGRPAGEPAAQRLRIMSLPDNVALLTAYGNDLNYDAVFVEQLKNLLDEGDVVVAISGSGESTNVLNALDYARSCGARTVGFTGAMPGADELGARCDVTVQAPLETMEQIEDMHVAFHHIVALMLRARVRERLSA